MFYAPPPRLVRQRERHDCGVAALAMLLGRTWEEVRDAARGAYPHAFWTCGRRIGTPGDGQWCRLRRGLHPREVRRIAWALAGEHLSTSRRWRQGVRGDRCRRMVIVRWQEGGRHYVVTFRGAVFDPLDRVWREEEYCSRPCVARFGAALVLNPDR